MPEQTLEKDRLDPRVWRIVSVAVLGSFLSQLHTTVVNVSLSSLAAELHSSLPVIQWGTSGYVWCMMKTTLSRPRIAKQSNKIMKC